MTALAVALAALLAISMTSNIVLFASLRSETKEGKAARDLIEQKEDLADEYRADRDDKSAKLKIAEDLAEQERTLRLVAVMQRDAAKKRTAELLRQHIPRASDAEIQELTDDVFSSPLSVVPLSKQPGNELMEPE